MKTLYFGVMSTASVNDYAFLPVIKKVGRAKLMAVASRDAKTAAAYAQKHGIPRSYGDYDSLLSDPLIDCVYIPLPVSMHAEWSIKALEAGKHVLCEKPVAANEKEARMIAAAAERSGRTFAEAFHYRYHPLSAKLDEIIRSGEIGKVTRVFSQFGVPLTNRNKPQFNPALAGGALLDIGCYPVSFARWIARCDEADVIEATTETVESGVDGSLSAKMLFSNGVEAGINCSLLKYLPQRATINGTKGSIHVFMPFSPAVDTGFFCLDLYIFLIQKGISVKSLRTPSCSTYYCQITEFCQCVRDGIEPLTNAREAIANMRLIDAIYEKAKQ